MPLYRRIYADLKAKIEAGAYSPGDRLPSELELTKLYGVSRITSRQALDLLCSEGLLVRRQGMGSFVAPPRVSQSLVRLTDFIEDMAEAGMNATSTVLRLGEEAAPPGIGKVLGLAEDAVVTRLDRLRLADDVPIALDWTWLPPAFGKLIRGEDLTSRTIYGILEAEYGIPVLWGEYTIGACVAGDDQAELLKIAPSDPLLVFRRTSFTTDRKPVYHQRRFYRADRVQYRLGLARTAPGETTIEAFEPVFAADAVPSQRTT
jgi:GntR family transcriptional regulator